VPRFGSMADDAMESEGKAAVGCLRPSHCQKELSSYEDVTVLAIRVS
jgi:hypothetical protein